MASPVKKPSAASEVKTVETPEPPPVVALAAAWQPYISWLRNVSASIRARQPARKKMTPLLRGELRLSSRGRRRFFRRLTLLLLGLRRWWRRSSSRAATTTSRRAATTQHIPSPTKHAANSTLLVDRLPESITLCR